MKGAIIILVVLGCALAVSSLLRGGSTRIRVYQTDYDCSCRSFCPTYGITAGPCDDGDRWGMTSQNCCLPSYLDNDRYDNDYRFHYTQPAYGMHGMPGVFGMPAMYGMTGMHHMYGMHEMYNSK